MIGGKVEEQMGSFGFEQGHALVWTKTPVERHPLYAQREALAARIGATRADWMMRTRQFNLFPNLQLAVQRGPADARDPPAQREPDRDDELLHRAGG